MAKGWLTKASRRKGDVWLYNFYTTQELTGKRVQSTVTVGLVSTFPREAAAWEEVKRRRLLGEDGESATRLTFNSLAKSYRDVELPGKARTTRDLHEHVMDNYILARWGARYIEEVRVLELRKWFKALADEKQLARVTIQKIKAIMQRLYGYGRENELLPTSLDPLKDVKLNGIGGSGKSKKIVIPFDVAWRIVQDLPVMARAIVMVAAVSGLRVSEILGLRWSDLDFEGMKINLSRTWHSGGGIGEGKTGASREPALMSRKVVQALQDWKQQTPYGADSDWVFASLRLKGKTPISGSQFVKDWLRPRFISFGVIEAGYKGRAGLHAFRHSLSTGLIVDEHVSADPKTAQALLRHANSDVTMEIYTHARESVMRAALDRVDSRMVN